ncbi:hypothetical protein HN832_03785 [archaeon]|jgi:arsenate reductase (thioredoxin)|nr:hypothetical protein [archaeon]MBT4373484.1 hypothetical protein [archaeon]MBT4531932.1 hypothetical protein [archaeon]MBT7001599.1 hypothetical protein [archaeon]MBT7282509.1 hypothetical protein [archaeon]
MKIIFVCKHNRFRSQLAEGFFKKYNKNKKIKVSSGGIFQGIPIAKNVKKVAKEFGIKLTKPSGIRERDLLKIDKIVVVANDLPLSLFKPRFQNVIGWKISDTSQYNLKSIQKIAREIEIKVKELVKTL